VGLDSDSPLILTDEPTGNFNSQMALEVIDLLVEISHGDKTLVIVTCDENVAVMAYRPLAPMPCSTSIDGP